jgi:hypothetical protein
MNHSPTPPTIRVATTAVLSRLDGARMLSAAERVGPERVPIGYLRNATRSVCIPTGADFPPMTVFGRRRPPWLTRGAEDKCLSATDRCRSRSSVNANPMNALQRTRYTEAWRIFGESVPRVNDHTMSIRSSCG